MSGFEDRLHRHLREWLGAWPPAAALHIVGSERRSRPGWDGRVYPVVGVASPGGTVVSVPPEVADAVRAVGPDFDDVGDALPDLVGRPGSAVGEGIFRWCHALLDVEPVGVWLPPGDERVPVWLRVFNGEVLVYLDDDGAYGAGVGRKQHDDWGQELAVATEPRLRGRGLGQKLVAQAARRVADEGAVATYLHAPANIASARVADHAGFPDAGWRVFGLPVAS